MTRKERRKAIVKRVAVRKLKETWRRKLAMREAARPPDDEGGAPETDAELDELPSSLVG